MATKQLLTELDQINGGDGSPSVVTPGQRWIFKGFVPVSGGNLQPGQFKVDAGVLTTYNIGSIIGTTDNPVIDFDQSPNGSYLFEYNNEICNFGTTLTLENATCVVPCNTGTADPITVCNGNCQVDLYTHMMGSPDNGGVWSQISGPGSLAFQNGDQGRVNFSGITVGTYVARYTVGTCSTDMTINVVSPPNAGVTTVAPYRCDDTFAGGANAILDFESLVGGTPGQWIALGSPPPFGIVNLVNKTYQPLYGDGGIIPGSGTYGTPKVYSFQKTVSIENIVPECANTCQSSAVLTANIYPTFHTGPNNWGINICNDGSTRNLRDLLNGETAGGQWDLFAVVVNGVSQSSAQLIVNGTLTNINIIGAPLLAGGSDNVSIGIPVGAPAGTYRIRYKLPNQSTTCAELASIEFNVQACTPSCTNDNPLINKNVLGNCVNATYGGGISSPHIKGWEYRITTTGQWQPYTEGTNICGETYVEFRLTAIFSNGCPTIIKSVSHTFINTTCTNSPTISANLNNCLITLSNGGSTTSPINVDQRQWRIQGSSTWQGYSSPIPYTGNITIEYRRIVSYSDGCPQSDTGIQTISGQCGTSCSVNISINGTGNILTANVSGCGSTSQSIEWRYSVDGNSYGGIIGTGGTFAPTQTGYYRASLTCGSCTDFDTYYFNTTPTDPCLGSTVSISQSGQQLIATRTGCSGSITYDWQFSSSGTGWGPATGNTNSATLTPANGAGFYRVFTFCNGQCMLMAEYEVTTGTGGCTSNPTISCQFNSSTCTYTLNPGGSIFNQITDTIWWKEAGSLNIHQYTGPFVYNGNIEFMREVSFFGGCPTITTPWTSCTGTCCSGNTIDVNCSFSQANCQYTLSSITNITNGSLLTDIIEWRPVGGSWNTYNNPFIYNGNIEYRRSVTLSGSCGSLQTPVKTCTGSCCSGNNPTVSGTFNVSTCLYTITTGGTNSSIIQNDIVEWRSTGGTNWNIYTSPFSGPSSIEIRRTVTYQDGCTASVPGTASGNCCNGNNPDVNCDFSNITCQYTLNKSGVITSPINQDIVRWRPQGASTWNTYSAPFTHSGQIEYQRIVSFTNGCPDSNTSIKTCIGSCCSNNNPDASCSFSGLNCTYTLNKTGNLAVTPVTDVIEWRTLGSAGAWNTYSGPFTNPNGSIEYRRVLTFTSCPSITTQIKTCQCCPSSNIGVTVSFNQANCLYTIQLTGSSTVAISTDITQWRQVGSSGAWNTYSTPFNGPPNIEVKRLVTYQDGCTAEANGTGSGICCNSNPGITCNKEPNTCTYTLTPTGSITGFSSDIVEWRIPGQGWNTYSTPFVNTGDIEYRRRVTYNNGCANYDSGILTCSGTCCNANPDVNCEFNATNCLYTLVPSGTNTGFATDTIQWRVQGNSTWNTYTVPFASNGVIEYRRIVTFGNGCNTITTQTKTCSNSCCLGNNPDVTCNYISSTCQFELNTTGTITSPVSSDVIEWRPQGASTWNTYSAPFSYSGTISYRRTVIYSNGCGQTISQIRSCSGTCCNGNNPTVTCSFDTALCRYTLTGGGQMTTTTATDVIYWRQSGQSGAYNVYSSPITFNGNIEFYRSVTFINNACAPINTPVQQCTGNCCGNNNPGISASFNPTDCKYTLQPTGTNTSTVTTDVMEWRQQGSGGAWTAYSVPFTGPANIEARRVVNYSNCTPVIATTTSSGTCCLGNTPDVTCNYDNNSCLITLTKTGSNAITPATDTVRWRINSASAWNIYTAPFSHNGTIEYQRVVTYQNCPTVSTSIYSGCGGVCCSGNQPDVSCNFTQSTCMFSATKTGTQVSGFSQDVIEYRPQGSSTWLIYTGPFLGTGAYEFRRTVNYTDGCSTKVSPIRSCSGDCCNSFNVSTVLAGNQLQATVSGCSGTTTVLWYYGTASNNINTLIGSGLNINPSQGAGYYEARATCSVGNCQDSSVIQFVCTGTATGLTADSNLSTLTVTGLSGCTSPSYFWEYSSNGSSWLSASGGTNSSVLTMNNGNGYYRVSITCNGICLFRLSYYRDCVCAGGTNATINEIDDTHLSVTTSGPGTILGYTWTAGSGGQIISGQGTTNITTNGQGSYYLEMIFRNSCGSTCLYTTAISQCICNASVNITKSGNVINASISGCSTFNSRVWTASGGGSILSGQGTNSISTNGVGSYYLSVQCVNSCFDTCNIVSNTISYLSICNNINSALAGGQGQFNQSFIANGNGVLTFYFFADVAPDRFKFKKNGVIVYDSGCMSGKPGGYTINPDFIPCPAMTFPNPTGAEFVDPFSGEVNWLTTNSGTWKIYMTVSTGDVIGIEVIGGCTGCQQIDQNTIWNVEARCTS